jgi:hypothetical protein
LLTIAVIAACVAHKKRKNAAATSQATPTEMVSVPAATQPTQISSVERSETFTPAASARSSSSYVSSGPVIAAAAAASLRSHSHYDSLTQHEVFGN